jgi:predicted extracellular nuclease
VAEDQDICTVESGALVCGAADDQDGFPDTLQELALRIGSIGGPSYAAVYDRDGADDRGIVAGFLYRTDRVQLRPVTGDDPVFGSAPAIDYRGTPLATNADVQNPKALNAVLPADVDLSTGVDGTNVYTRAPQVGSFRVWRDGIGTSVFTDLYAISNHFSSTPDARVGQRREQAAYNAAIVDVLDGLAPRVLTGGDLNVYPRPDDPFSPGDPLYPSDQLAPLYAAGLTNLWDVEVDETPAAAYSYVFQGQAQTLDQTFVTPTLEDELTEARTAHVNSDFPADEPGDGPRGTSDHDPMASRYLTLPTLDRMDALVEYLDETGQITGRNTKAILLGSLDRARRFQAEGKRVAYAAQLVAFAAQARALAPRQLTVEAGNALAREALLLLATGS